MKFKGTKNKAISFGSALMVALISILQKQEATIHKKNETEISKLRFIQIGLFLKFNTEETVHKTNAILLKASGSGMVIKKRKPKK